MSISINIPKLNTPGVVGGKLLRIARIEQTMSEWCFAACGEMISKYFGRSVTQCTIANSYLQGFGSCTDACNDSSRCNSPCQIQKISGLYKVFGISSVYMNRPADNALIEREIVSAQRPVMALLTFAAGGGHVLLITGWLPNGPHGPMVYAIDTRRNYSEGWYDYNAILRAQNGQGGWVGSWIGISSI